MKRLRNILKGIGMGLCVLGLLWFLMPLLKGGFGIGMVLGLAVCALGFLLLLGYRWLSRKGSWQRIAARAVSVCYVLGLCWCGYLSLLMFSAQNRVPPPGTNVMVLGSQVYSIDKMGVSLTKRVERAREYLAQNPEASCIVTGGQGSNEPCAEAEAERHALLQAGVSESRIFMEDKSSNTRENMNFSKAVAEENGLGTEFVIVTQSFHMYRALMLAEDAGLTPYALVADTDPVLFPLYYGRELLSLTKWNFERLFLS